jgi:hypothetical protein
MRAEERLLHLNMELNGNLGNTSVRGTMKAEVKIERLKGEGEMRPW